MSLKLYEQLLEMRRVMKESPSSLTLTDKQRLEKLETKMDLVVGLLTDLAQKMDRLSNQQQVIVTQSATAQPADPSKQQGTSTTEKDFFIPTIDTSSLESSVSDSKQTKSSEASDFDDILTALDDHLEE